MKKILSLFIFLIVSLAQAQQINWQEASTAQMSAGAVGAPFVVTPRRAATGNSITANGVATLTNKTINGSSNTLTVLGASQISGLIPTANGGNNVDITASAPSIIGSMGFRNRMTNGAERFDQRKVGTSTTAATFANVYTTDKWQTNLATSCTGTVIQQVTDAPAGFLYSNKITIGTGASPAAGDINTVRQQVEGVEIQDLGFGGANAVATTFSFWVKSSVTGTETVSFVNSAQNRNYLAQYTINSASTWEQKTITFTVDASGTWLTAAGTVGCYVSFDIGSGSNSEGTASTWQAGNLRRISTNAKIVATSSATFQITGVQWERGSAATSYEQIPYAVELARCQRYYDTSIEAGATVTTFATLNASGVGGVMGIADAASADLFPNVRYHVPMASSPTLTVYSGVNRTAGSVRNMVTGTDVSGFANGAVTSSNMGFGYITGGTLVAGVVYGFQYVADTGL